MCTLNEFEMSTLTALRANMSLGGARAAVERSDRHRAAVGLPEALRGQS